MPEGTEAEEGEPFDGPTERQTDDGPDAPRGPGGPSRVVLVAVGLLVGLLLGGLAAWLTTRGADDATDDDVESATTAPETAEAAVAFVEAWERSRTATFLTGSLLTRTTEVGMLEIPIVVAQRPPDRVISSGRSTEGTVGGEQRVCDEQLDGLVHCGVTSTPGESFEEKVAAEVAVLRSYFEADLPLYAVAGSGSCFDLRLTRAVHAPPFGQSARFCFDAASGAPQLQRIERPEGTDVVVLVSVRTDVTEEDLARVAAGEVDQALLEG